MPPAALPGACTPISKSPSRLFLPIPSTRLFVYARKKLDRKLPLIPSLKEFIVGIETDKSFLRYLIPVIVLGVC